MSATTHDFNGPFVPAGPGLTLGKARAVCTQCGGLEGSVPWPACPYAPDTDALSATCERVIALLEPDIGTPVSWDVMAEIEYAIRGIPPNTAQRTRRAARHAAKN